MSTYDDQVNDYLRAVEQALHGVPAGRRDELLAGLSDHIAGKLAETRPADASPATGEVHSVLDLLGDPEEVAAGLAATPPPADVVIDPGRRVGALIWVLATVAMVSLLCVGIVLAGVFLFFTRHR